MNNIIEDNGARDLCAGFSKFVQLTSLDFFSVILNFYHNFKSCFIFLINDNLSIA
jgi:hypothetical protein